METMNYEIVLKTIYNWPPAQRLRLMQDILKSLLPELVVSQESILDQAQGNLTTNRPISSDLASDRAEIPPDSLTARFRGFVQSPLTVAELTAAYELQMMGDDEESD